MYRREVLRRAAPAALVLSAGCLSTGSANPATSTTQSSTTSGSSPTSTEATSETTSAGDALRVTEKKLIHEGEGEDASVRARLQIENAGADSLGQVVATATFVEDEVLLDSWVATANGLDAGQQWEVSISSGGTSGEDATAVTGVQAAVEERTPPSDLDSSRIEIVEDKLVREDDGVRVEGVAENVGADRLEYATVVATFASSEDVLLGKALTDTTRDVDPGQRLQFSIRYNSPVRAADVVAGYQLTTDADIETGSE